MEPENGNLRLMLEHLPDAFAYHQIVTDSEGKPVDYIFLDVNPAFEEMTGFAREKIIGKKAAEVYPDIKESSFDWISAYGQVALTGETLRFEHYYKPLESWYELTVYRDKPGYLATLFRDVTSYKKEQTKLQKEKSEMTALLPFKTQLLNTAAIWIDILDKDGKVTFWNKAAERISGYTAEEVIGHARIWEWLYPDPEYHANVLGKAQAIIHKGEKVENFETQIRRKDGLYRTISWYSNNLVVDGQIIGSIALGVDITEQKKYEEALQESELKYRMLFEETLIPILLVNDAGYYVDANQAALDFLEISLDELYKKQVFDFAPTDLLEKQKHEHMPFLERRTLETEYHIQGKVKTLLLNVVPVKIAGKNYLFGIGQDITDRKQAQEALEQLYYLLDEELDKARQVHEQTLPTKLPTVQGVTMAAHYQPAAQIGGDFYDVIHAGDKLIFYLSDVSGHGLDGAMLSVFVKHTIKSYISFSSAETIRPAKIMRHLAEQLHQEHYPEELYIAIFLAVLDLETMELTYCGAGFQDTPLLRLGNGEQLKLISKGLFISRSFPLEVMDFKEDRKNLTPGSTIFCNTDGLTEQGSNGLYYMDRLPNIFYENAHLPPQLVAQVVIEDFRRFNGGALQGKDDITFLVLQVDPPEKKNHHLELASDFTELKRLRENVWALLTTRTEKAHAILSGLYELTSNAIEHGNRFDPEKTVFIELNISEEYIQASVEDQGEGFNWQEKIDKHLELSGNQERGRGIAMTRICSEQLVYNHKGNRAIFAVTTGERGR